MLLAMSAVLLVFWFIGILTSHTLGGAIHILLIIATIIFLLRLIREHRFL